MRAWCQRVRETQRVRSLHNPHSRDPGVKIKCRDGRDRTVFVRVLGFSGDAPELNEIAARAGSCDPALDADVGSDEHLFHFSGGTPRCVLVALHPVLPNSHASRCRLAAATREAQDQYATLLRDYSTRQAGSAVNDKLYTNIGRMPWVHPFYMEPAALRVMRSRYISEMLLFDRLHNVCPPSVKCALGAVQRAATPRLTCVRDHS